MECETRIRRKLIEVALPLDAINAASAREKSIRHGHPSTLHLWWARRPLAAVRAVIFAQMVDDPSANPALFPTEKAQGKERERLFEIIRQLVKWENTTNETMLEVAREEIRERVRLFFVGGRISLCGSEAGGNWIRHGVVREQRRGPVADGTCAVSDGWGCSAGTRALGGGSQYASMRRRPVAA